MAPYEPYVFYKDREEFAPYIYRGDSAIEYKDLADFDYYYFTWDWYTLPKGFNEPIWTEPYYDEGGGDIVMSTYSIPFYDRSGDMPKFKGVVTADLDLSWLEDLMSSIKVYETGYAFIIFGRA